jgi:hypothetical protein
MPVKRTVPEVSMDWIRLDRCMVIGGWLLVNGYWLTVIGEW